MQYNQSNNKRAELFQLQGTQKFLETRNFALIFSRRESSVV